MCEGDRVKCPRCEATGKECLPSLTECGDRMKALIAYYSRTGNNEKLVNELRAKLECDIEKIVDTVNRKGVWGWIKGGRDASRKKCPG